jgi:hypothetical protein
MRNPLPVEILAYLQELSIATIAATITIAMHYTANPDAEATERLASQWRLEHVRDPRDHDACRGLLRRFCIGLID